MERAGCSRQRCPNDMYRLRTSEVTLLKWKLQTTDEHLQMHLARMMRPPAYQIKNNENFFCLASQSKKQKQAAFLSLHVYVLCSVCMSARAKADLCAMK